MSLAETPDIPPVTLTDSVGRREHWRSLGTAAAVAEALIDVYEQRGFANDDGVVSQTDHALQCGAHAMAAHATVATIVTAFLHDLGHLLVEADVSIGASAAIAPIDRGQATPSLDVRHEVVGAEFLDTWFDESVTEPIRLHVAAKRYLCTVDPDYHATLSPASIRSLELQGGPMSLVEFRSFAARPDAARAVELRRWDDLAKEVVAPVPSLDTFRTLVESVVTTVPNILNEPGAHSL